MTDSNLISPIYATYGNKDNKHQLIYKSNPEVNLPNHLLSVTDKPAGYLSPNVTWHPVLGCEVFNDYWCLWCTYPDFDAPRSGMVKSEVALLPANQAIELTDLTDILLSIMNIDELPAVSDTQLINIFDSLISSDYPVLILESLSVFAAIINGLWKGLWPEARKRLVCHVKWNPAQTLASESEFNIVASIASNKLRWTEPYTVISPDENNYEVIKNRAVQFLLNHNDTILESLLKSSLLAIEKPPLKRLKRLSKTADLINDFKVKPSAPLAINLIRNCLSFKDTSDLDDYINEALKYLADNLVTLDFKQIETMRNLAFKRSHECSLLSISLENYITSKFMLLKQEDRHKLLVDAMNKTDRWWYIALKKGVGKGVDTLSPNWLQQAKQLILDEKLATIADDVISDSKDMENGIIELVTENEPSDNDIEKLKEFSRSKNWSKLYAWGLFKLEQPIVALNNILDFEHPNTVGFNYLSELYSENELLVAFRVMNDARLVSNIENKNELIDRLLPYLELDKDFDRWLLSKGYINHLPIPSNIITNDAIDSILLSATNGNEIYGLIEYLAGANFGENIAKRALLHLNGNFAWDKLSKADVEVLINTVSQHVIENDISNVTDKRIQGSIRDKFLNLEIAPKVLDLLIGWNVHVNEPEVTNILRQYTDDDWRQYGEKLGKFISLNGWKASAKVLNRLYKDKDVVNSALRYCYDLLPKTQKYPYLFKSKINSTELPDKYIINRLVEEVSTLYNSEELELLWEQAGGKLKDLGSKGTLGTQWTKAIKKARKGKIDGGVVALIDIMLEEYPHNTKLNELKGFFRAKDI